jgi:acid stress-induced BolA-like protein IbaG/YrbA
MNALFRPKMMFGGVSEHFSNLRHVKRCKTCVSGLNALFRGTEVANHTSYYIGTKMMFRSVSDHFANLRHVKRCKTCALGMNALLRDTDVAKHPLYCI